MPLVPIPGFCGSSYLNRSRGVSSARTVNLRVEKTQDPTGTPYQPIPVSKTPFVMFPRSGKKRFAILPTSPNQGCWANKTRVFAVGGGVVYELFQDGTNVALGTIAIGSNPVTMRANGNQLLICSAGNVYVATGTQIYQPIISFARGLVDVTGTDVNWVSGDKFQGEGGDILPGHLFSVDTPTGTMLFTVVAVNSPTNLELDSSASALSLSSVNYQAGETLLYGAICEFIDGYFIINVPNTKTFMISALEDGKTWPALNTATKSGSTDNIACVKNLNGQLALIGDTNSTEVWGDSGNADFPFQRISGATMPIGTDAPWSVAQLADGSLFWLACADGGTGVIVRTVGGQPQRVSDHAFENAMRTYPRLDDAIACTYVENGHMHYRIDFPTADKSWEYDAITGVWVEIGVYTAQDEVYGCDLGRFNVWVTWPNENRMHLAFDYSSGKVFQVSPDFVDDDGVDFPVMRIAPHINTNLERSGCDKFALDCEMGTIDPTAKGADGKPLIPTISLFYSDDGGRTWADAGAASLGRAGEYEGSYIDIPTESFDVTPNSQTNPQVFEAIPMWHSLGSFWISKTFKVKSNGRMLRAIYNGLVQLGQVK